MGRSKKTRWPDLGGSACEGTTAPDPFVTRSGPHPAAHLFQVLRKFVPTGEDILGLLVNAPQQGEAAKEQQAGHAHRGCEDDGHDDPGGGCLCREDGACHGLVTRRQRGSDPRAIFAIATPWRSLKTGPPRSSRKVYGNAAAV